MAEWVLLGEDSWQSLRLWQVSGKRTDNIGSELGLGVLWQRKLDERGLQNGSDWRRVVERGPHFPPTLKFLHFSPLFLLGFKGSSPTSEHFVFEVLPRLLERKSAKLGRRLEWDFLWLLLPGWSCKRWLPALAGNVACTRNCTSYTCSMAMQHLPEQFRLFRS